MISALCLSTEQVRHALSILGSMPRCPSSSTVSSNGAGLSVLISSAFKFPSDPVWNRTRYRHASMGAEVRMTKNRGTQQPLRQSAGHHARSRIKRPVFRTTRGHVATLVGSEVINHAANLRNDWGRACTFGMLNGSQRSCPLCCRRTPTATPNQTPFSTPPRLTTVLCPKWAFARLGGELT